jgi:serine/threonine-protein kinase
VFRARDERHERNVALKLLRPEVAASIGPDRFRREIRVAASLQHTNIVPVYDSGVADGIYFLVMPYIEGQSLRERLRHERKLSVTDALQITREIADALAYAHSRDVVHRDVKPANILLAGGHALIADFGIARAIAGIPGEPRTATGIAMGTPQYMSPEQGSAETEIDGRSDVYSLGCVLYEMLAGQPPFTASNVPGLLAKHRYHAPAPLAKLRKGIPPDVVAVTSRAMEKLPADRFKTAAEFRDAIDSLLATLNVGRWRWSRVYARPRLRSWSLRTAFVVVLTIALAFLLARFLRTPTLDPHRVVVFPIRMSGARDAGIDGEAIATYIGYALENTEPLRWFEARQVLRDLGTGDASTLTLREMRAASRSAGAGHFFDGDLFSDADSVRVVLSLQDVQGDSLVRRASAAGPAGSSMPQLALRAVAQVLPVLVAPGVPVDIAALESRPPAAITAFLTAERDYREMRYEMALQKYERALETDSTFALAAMRGALSAAWLGRRAEQAELMHAVWQAPNALPLRLRTMAAGVSAFLEGAADSAILHLKQAIALDSTKSDGYLALGDVYHHLLPQQAAPDSAAEAEFRRALVIDPGLVPARYWLAELSLFRGDTVPLSELIADRGTQDHGSDVHEPLRLALECIRNPRSAPWSRTRSDPLTVLRAGKYLATNASHPGCAESALTAVAADSASSAGDLWGALLTLNGLYTARADAGGLQRVDSLARDRGFDWSLLILRGLAGAADSVRVTAAVAGRGRDFAAMRPPTLWLLGSWFAMKRDSPSVAQVVAALRSIAARSGSPRDRFVARVSESFAPIAAGDAARAVRILRSLRPTASIEDITWQPWESLGFERLGLARLLANSGQNVEAMDVAAMLDSPQPVTYLHVLRPGLELRIELARRLGDADLEKRLRARLDALGSRDAGFGTRVSPSR